jgi:hypothetical protein
VSGKIGSSDPNEEVRLVENAKRVALLALGMSFEKFKNELEHQQQLMMNLADIIMETFAMESTLLRTRKRAGQKAGIAPEMCAVFLQDSIARIELAARNVLGACWEGQMLRMNMSVLRKLTVYDPVNAISLRRGIAERLLDRERYAL